MNLLIRNSLIPIDEKVAEELEQISKLQIKSGNGAVARLIGNDGEEITLHAPLIEVLKEVARLTQQQDIAHIRAFNGKLTVLQAANILHMAEKHIGELLETNKIPYQDSEQGRLIDYDTLMNYKNNLVEDRDEGVKRLMELEQELGLYD
jgi:hypothetical protein